VDSEADMEVGLTYCTVLETEKKIIKRKSKTIKPVQLKTVKLIGQTRYIKITKKNYNIICSNYFNV